MPYKVVLSPAAQRDIARLDEKMKLRTRARITELGEDPRPPGCKMLKGPSAGLRMRLGDWRILYEVRDAERIVEVGHVRHRSKVYRNL